MNIEQIKYKFLNAGIIEQLIYVNVSIYILTFILGIFGNHFLYEWFALPSDFNTFIKQPWTIISYGFLHTGFIHLFSNLLALFYFGNLFLDYFTPKQALNFYLLGTLVGGLFFLLGSYFIPSLSYSQLVGASAGVSAILIGIATYLPNYQMKFALIGYIKLWHIVLFWIGYNLLLITANSNLGGNLAHLGGALFGFLYVQQVSNKKLDIFNTIRKWFSKKDKPLKTVYKSKEKTNNKRYSESENQEKIDKILDKIGKSGYDSLSKEEKDFLFKQGQ